MDAGSYAKDIIDMVSKHSRLFYIRANRSESMLEQICQIDDWKEVEYLNKEYPYKERVIPVSKIIADGGYYFKLLSDNRKTFFLSFGLSASAGYETSNWGEKLLYDGATLVNKDAFIYGGSSTIEVETYLSDRLVLLINARERLLFGSSIEKFQTQYGIGIKYIIN